MWLGIKLWLISLDIWACRGMYLRLFTSTRTARDVAPKSENLHVTSVYVNEKLTENYMT